MLAAALICMKVSGFDHEARVLDREISRPRTYKRKISEQ